MRSSLASPSLVLVALSSLAVAAAAGCISDSDPAAAPLDGGGFETGVSSDGGGPGNDAGGAGVDGGGGDGSAGDSAATDSGAVDSGDSGDAATTSGPLSACDPATRVDTLRGVNGAVTLSAAGYGDKWVVTWFQIASVSPDSQYHWKARYFDGAALATEVDLGIDVYGVQNPIVADGSGRAFAQRFNSSDSDRRVFDFATGTFASATTFPVVNSGDEFFALAPIPGGGALSLFRNGTNVVADKWVPATPSWTTTGLAGLPALSYGLRVAANAAGKAVALWYNSDGSGGNDLHVAAYDGATWSAPVTKSLPNDGGSSGEFQPVMLPNGDAIIGWVQSGTSIVTSRFHGGTFDAPVEVEAAAGSAKLDMVADSAGRVSVAFFKGGHVHVRRDLGAGYLAEQDVATATDYRLAVNPATDEVTLVTYNLPTLQIQRIAPTSNTWTASLPMNMGISNGTLPKRQTAVVFDSAGRPTVLSMQDASGSGGLELFAAKCH